MAIPADEIQTMFDRLSPADQRRVLEFIRDMAEGHPVPVSLPGSPLPKGKPGDILPDPKSPLEVVEEEAEEEEIEQTPPDSEQIDVDEW